MSSSAPTDHAAPIRTQRRRRIALRALAALIIAALLCAALVVALVTWAARSEAGMRTLLSFAPGVRVSAPHGTLLGDFEAERVDITLPRGGAVVLTQPRWRALRLERLESAPWGFRLAIERLEARQVQLRAPTADDRDAKREPPR